MKELFEQLTAELIGGNEDDVPVLVQQALDQGLAPQDILDKGLLPGMNEVGARFERCEMFVPSVLMAATAMQNGLAVLRPQLVATGAKPLGKIVLGTVQGDIHDIGKNLVAMLCEGAGFEVINLGFDTPTEKFLEAIKTEQPDVVGMSAMLTTTMLSMGHTIKAIEEAGLRGQVKIIVGGAPVDAEIAQRLGADGYGYNAPVAVKLVRSLLDVA